MLARDKHQIKACTLALNFGSGNIFITVKVSRGLGDEVLDFNILGNILGQVGDGLGHLGVGHLGDAGGGGDCMS